MVTQVVSSSTMKLFKTTFGYLKTTPSMKEYILTQGLGTEMGS